MTYNIGFDIFAKDHASKEFKSLGDNMEHASTKGQKLGKVAGTVVVGGLAAAVGFAKQSTDAYTEAAAAQRVLTDAYGRHVKMQDVSKQSYLDQAAALQQKTKFDGDEINAMQGKLGAYGLTGKEIQRLTPLVLDYAEKTGKDLPTAAKDMGKAVMGQGRGLKALGINFKDTHTKAGNLNQIMGGLRKQVGGFAEKEGKTAEGRAATMKNTFGDFQEDVGKNLIPVLTKLFKVGITIVTWMTKNEKLCGILIAVFGGLAATIWVVTKAAKAFRAAQAAVNLVMKMNTLGMVITAVALMAAGLIYAYKHSKTFRDIVNGAWTTVKNGAHAMWYGVIRPIFTTLSSWFMSLWRTAGTWARTIRAAWTSVGTGMTTLWNSVLRPYFKFIVDAWLKVAGWIVTGASTAFGWIPGIGPKLKTAARKFNTFRDDVNRALGGVHPRTVGVTANFSWAQERSLKNQRANNKHNAMGMKDGGPVRGGVPGQDSVPAVLMPNEFVVKADGSNLADALAHFGHGFANGGLAVKPRTPKRAAISSVAQGGWAANLLSNVPSSIAGLIGQMGSIGSGGGGGAGRWMGTILKVLAMLHQSPAFAGAIMRRINLESGGNPHAINLWDSNAKAGHPSMGLMQTIMGTFNAWAGPFRGLGIWNPLANIFAGTNYALHTYGSLANIDPRNRPYGYDRGGFLPPGLSTVYNGTGKYETITPPGAGMVGGGTLTVQLVLDGRIIQQSLLNLKRRNGGGSLNL